MRIALDIRYSTQSGASSYIEKIVPLLLQESRHDFVLVRYRHQEIHINGQQQESIVFEGRSRVAAVVWDQLVLPRRLAEYEVDLYHALKLLGPIRTPCPKITVAHSITTPFRGEFPASSPLHAAYWNVLGNPLYRSSDHVIAVSEYVKAFVVEKLGMPAESVTVIPHGIDPRYDDAKDRAGELPSPVRVPYLLVVGNIFPVKNHLTAVRAFSRVALQLPEHQLVIAGSTESDYAGSVREEIDRLGLSDRVHLMGFVAADRLTDLYRQTDLLLLPSLTEGFGFTLLEAMACGAPVLASRRGSLPEVGGEAVRLLDDPQDVEGWAAATLELAVDSVERRFLSEKGRQRAQAFSWRRSAQDTLAVYERWA